jgi:glycosyltransferase involved in cell wall biosynthesis
MKILQLIDSLEIGGAERMAVNMANMFYYAGVENLLVCARKNGPLNEFLPPNLAFFVLNKKSTIDIKAFLSLIKIINKQKPNVIHVHSSSIYWGIKIKLLYPRIKLIWHDHYGLSEQLKDTDRKLIRLLSNKIDGVVVVNKTLELWANQNLDTKSILYLRNFPFLSLENIVSRKEKNVILHLANLRPQKDHETLIDAIKILQCLTKVDFQVWCAGIDLNDSYSEKIKTKIVSLGLIDKITLLGAVKDTAILLSKSGMGVLSSSSEGLPVSLLEYGLAGLPVVVTDVGQCADVLEHGSFGSLVPPSDPKKLAYKILWHLENREESIAMGKEFKEHVEKEYGGTKFLNEYLKFIKSL